MRARRFGDLVTVALFTILLGSTVRADDGLIGERPNAGGPPEEIRVMVAILDIDGVNDRDQQFNVDAFYEISWLDPRLANDDDESRGSTRTFGLDEIWTPGLTIINNRGMSPLLPQVASVEPDGRVTIRQRSAGALAVKLDLHRFPFDTQRLTMQIVSYRYDPSQLVYSSDSRLITNPETFSAAGWHFEPQDPEFAIYRLTEDGVGSSELTFGLLAERDSGFFILTLALPMALILSLAWMVHWLQPDIIPARIGMSTAMVFSLIALGVSFRLTLPRIDYLTRADHFVIYSTLLVLLSLAATVTATRWHNADKEAAAKKLTLYTRWSFPFVFAAIVALSIPA